MKPRNSAAGNDSGHGNHQLLLGIDGGGSKTTALVASLDNYGEIIVLGRGQGGPSNFLSAGTGISLESLNQALNAALAEAEVKSEEIACSVLALAGSSSADVQDAISAWAISRSLCSNLEIVHDILPVLISGTDEGCGVALIVGTGSVAMGTNLDGRSILKGGWGHLFGDKGSGFGLGHKALAAIVDAADEIGPRTLLSGLVLKKLGIDNPRDIIKEITSYGDVQRDVAALAPVVLEAASLGDKVACGIVSEVITKIVQLVSAVAENLAFTDPYPLALAGGVVCHSQPFRQQLIAGLEQLQPQPARITVVNEPVIGCLEIARANLQGPDYKDQITRPSHTGETE